MIETLNKLYRYQSSSRISMEGGIDELEEHLGMPLDRFAMLVFPAIQFPRLSNWGR